MGIPHLVSGQVCSVLPLGSSLLESKTNALFRGPHLEVIRMVLPSGKEIPAHHVRGPITIHCIEGEVEIGVEDELRILRPGDLLYLAGNVKHDLRAMTNCSILVSIVLLTEIV